MLSYAASIPSSKSSSSSSSSSSFSSSSSPSPPRSHPYRRPTSSSFSHHHPKTRAYVAELPKIQWRTLPQDLLLLLDSYIDPLTQYSIIRRVNVYWKTTLALNPRKIVPLYIHRMIKDWGNYEKEKKEEALKRMWIPLRNPLDCVGGIRQFVNENWNQFGGVTCTIRMHWIFHRPTLQTLRFLRLMSDDYYARLLQRIDKITILFKQKREKFSICNQILRRLSHIPLKQISLYPSPINASTFTCFTPQLMNILNMEFFVYLPEVKTFSLVDMVSLEYIDTQLHYIEPDSRDLKRIVLCGVKVEFPLHEISFVLRHFENLEDFRIITNSDYCFLEMVDNIPASSTFTLNLPRKPRPPVQVIIFNTKRDMFILSKWVMYKKLGRERSDLILDSTHPDFHGGLGCYFFKVQDIREEKLILPGPDADRVQSIYHQLQTIQV